MKGYLLKNFDFQGNGMDLWECVSGEPHAFFLDSSQHDPSRGRFSCIGFDPFDTFVHKGKDTLALLKEKFTPFVDDKKEGSVLEVPLPSGIVGCLSYDYGLYHEKIRLRAQDDLGLPDAFFGFYDAVLTIDHFTKKLFITSSGLPERDPSLRAKRAEERLERIIRKIDPFLRSTVVSGSEEGKGLLRAAAGLRSNFTREQYEDAVGKALDYISRGDIYQVNLSQRFELDCSKNVLDPREVYRALRGISPVSFGGYIDGGDFTIISNSPERLLRLHNGIAETRPMKGTRPRGENPALDRALRMELIDSAKEKAELLMITDLLRNDLGRVCDYGSVRVREMRTIEEYGYVFQATSTVEGALKKNKDCFDLLNACFPGGSVTGCPKIRAMEIIEELEPTRRGMYTGALGYINFNGGMDFNILIRTLLARRGKMYFQVGGGIVSDSTPEKEYEETLVKARAIQEALGQEGHVPVSLGS